MSTATDALAELRREIGVRRRVYPNWIRKGDLKQADADKRLAAMEEAARIVQRSVDLQRISNQMTGRETHEQNID